MEATRSKVVRTSCGQCYIGCAIEVTVDDGVVTNLSGNPASPQNRGKMCAKGKAGIMNLYNPNRVKVPLKRTNPGKGMDVDPGWVEITWEEAIDTIVRQLERIRDTPKKLLIHSWEVMGDNLFWLSSFGNAFGAYLTAVVASPDCGKVVHPVEYFSGGGFHQQPDLHYANYCILVGTQLGVASRASFNHLLLDMANARERGMKLVVVDPVGGHAGSKANEWVPIRPGTDGAWGLGMLHVLLNELGIYDREFLADKTNSPYLVGPDGHYLRDRANGQPLVHDLVDGATKAHDDPSLKRAAINGTYAVDGTAGRTAFDLLREHVAKYPPEVVEKITTIPAATVRRMAREFGEAARIGETIEIDGVTLPYRPVCVDWAKGAQGHTHGFHNCWPLKLLNIVVGAVNVPGGILSTGAAGKFPHEWWPEAGTDGMLEHGGQIFPMGHPSSFPGRTPARPLRADIAELFPLAPHYHTLLPIVFDDPSKFGLQSGQAVEVMMHSPNNAILGNFGDVRQVERFYQSLEFIFGFAVEINETTLFDDIVLPFPSYLERWDFVPGVGAYYLAPSGQDDFHWQIRQPVVDVPPGVRQPQEVLQEIADRLGILDGIYRLLNHTFSLNRTHQLETGKRYRVPEIIDKATRSWFGEDRGLAWFQEHGIIRHPRSVEEAYIGASLDARIPVYLEHFLTRGEQLKAIVEQMNLDWDLADFKPFSDWMPCPSYAATRDGAYDLIAVHFKFPFVYGAYGAENPIVDELCEKTHAYRILINSAVARKKGINEGDSVWLESPVRKVRATVRLTECIHPEVVGIGGHFGHWSQGMPISRGKGVAFNALCCSDLDHIDKISTALDQCVQVKVYK